MSQYVLSGSDTVVYLTDDSTKSFALPVIYVTETTQAKVTLKTYSYVFGAD